MADVKLNNIKKSFGNVNILHGISLDIKHGEFVVLVGASGCGKSTLLRLIAGLEEITSGSLEISGREVNHIAPAQRGIAMVFQSYALYPHMNVFKNMSYGLKVNGKGKDFIKEKVLEAANTLDIGHLLERLPRELSGGQRQRVAIGRAIVRDPNVFLFDEPLSNLDAALRVQTRVEIGKLHKKLGTTIIYVTHDQIEAMTLGDKIVVMNEGLISQAGTPLELYQHPCNKFVAGFIGSPKMNMIPGKVLAIEADHLLVELSDKSISKAYVETDTASIGDNITFGIRPEHLVEGALQETSLSAKVSLIEQLGEATYLYLTLGDGSEIVMRGEGESTTTFSEQINISLKPEHVHIFNSEGIALRRTRAGNTKSPAQLAQLKAQTAEAAAN
ncbi:MAG: sn-glycerol-3-phosphate ABC transporter ATP-binding protein UgpC [Oceanospirillaceae bacterium]|nr:sn-glycerol-3-phosphate ABC transporter ATP-binding protein UgpC [Oceanospirillaceae bacterium]